MKRWQVGDVMTGEVVVAPVDMGYKEIADLLVRRSVSAVPVVDDEGNVLGVVSEADLLAKLEYSDRVPRHPLAVRWLSEGRRKACGDTAGDLMSAPAITVPATESVTRVARLMDAARVKRLPVVDESGHLVGIVSRRDLVRLYTRPDDEVRVAIAEGVLPALWIDPSGVDVQVRAGIVTLSGRVDRRSTVAILIRATLATPGVVDVVDNLDFDVDDAARAGARKPRPHMADVDSNG